MDLLWSELVFGFGDWRDFGRVIIRLTAATIFGAAIGIERESAGKAAGVRTHMLVTLGTAAFVIACSRGEFSNEGLSRVIQGVVTGIGFIGAGSIIKSSDAMDVRGLTTSAGIWMAAAIGVAVGLGAVGFAAVATVFALLILTFAVMIDNRITKGRFTREKPTDD